MNKEHESKCHGGMYTMYKGIPIQDYGVGYRKCIHGKTQKLMNRFVNVAGPGAYLWTDVGIFERRKANKIIEENPDPWLTEEQLENCYNFLMDLPYYGDDD